MSHLSGTIRARSSQGQGAAPVSLPGTQKFAYWWTAVWWPTNASSSICIL